MKTTLLIKKLFHQIFGSGEVPRSQMLAAVANKRETTELAVLESMLPLQEKGGARRLYSQYLKDKSLPVMVIHQCRIELDQT